MSRYWVFQNNQVVGPHDVGELPQLPGYGPESLVCPEGRKGTNMGDWQRASMVAELAVSLTKASQLTAAGRSGASYGGLPPEPTLKDLAQLGGLQEKVAALDSTVSQLQDNLRLKEAEILSLHKELEDKSAQAQDLAVKLGGLEERLAAVGSLQQNLDRAVAAEQDVESTVQKQAKVIDDLSREIDRLKSEQKEIEKLKSDLEELRRAPAAAAAPAALSFAPAPAEPALLETPAPKFEPLQGEPPLAAAPATAAEAPLSLAPPAPSMEGAAPAPSPSAFEGTIRLEPPSEKPDLLFKPEPLASLSESPKMETVPPLPAGDFGAAPGIELGASGEGAGPVNTLSAVPFPAPAGAPPVVAVPPPAGTDLAPAKKKRGKSLALVGVLIIGGAAAAAFKLGLLAPAALKRPAQMAPPPAPEPPAVPKTPSPEEQAEAARQAAIDVVRKFPTPKGMTIGDSLEAGLKKDGGLSPWMAEKLPDETFQVNFFSSKPAGGNGQTYSFQASMTDGKVAGLNPVAKALLATEPPPAPPKKRARRPAMTAKAAVPRKRMARRVPKAEAATLDDLLQGGGQAAKKDDSLDQMLLPGTAPDQAGQAQPAAEGEPAAAPASAAPKADAAPATGGSAQKGSDADLLDTMLKP